MKKMSDFSAVFNKKIERRSKGYSETRVKFDEYLINSLKTKLVQSEQQAHKLLRHPMIIWMIPMKIMMKMKVIYFLPCNWFPMKFPMNSK